LKALVLVLLTLLAPPALAADRDKPVAVSETAPDIVLRDQHGRPFRLSDALAQRDFVVVAFFVKAFTGG
jgi:cytochrome oxidase Cu insertion factor (SCO1/SenC/PrrC family)